MGCGEDHEARPVLGTAYTVGATPNTGQAADERRPDHYPAEGLCDCGEVIRRDSIGQGWAHTGRKPGEPS